MKVVEIGLAKPNKDVIEGLEELLEEAKQGRLRGYCVTAAMADGSTMSYIMGKSDSITMLGLATALMLDISNSRPLEEVE
jgi:hypothetical protein